MSTPTDTTIALSTFDERTGVWSPTFFRNVSYLFCVTFISSFHLYVPLALVGITKTMEARAVLRDADKGTGQILTRYLQIDKFILYLWR